ncbi:MAG: amidohydrolase family protein [Flavobacteriales bacterium]|jgi:predicted TIM-barrel fold metal-dependent hydrolase
MIIDANVHITPDGKWFTTPHDASLDRLRACIEEAGITAAIAVPLPGTIGNPEQEKLIAGDQKIIHACTFNPALYATPQEAAQAFNVEFGDGKKRFVKFHNRFGKYHAEDERFYEVIRMNDALQVPMVIGVCGLLHDRNTPGAVDASVYFFNLGLSMKNSNLIIMHGGGTRILQIAEMCRDLHHVFFDLSMTLSKYKGTSVAGDIRWLCQHYDRRMIWASDFPEVSIAQALNDFDEVVGPIAAEKRANILGGNIVKLLDIAMP